MGMQCKAEGRARGGGRTVGGAFAGAGLLRALAGGVLASAALVLAGGCGSEDLLPASSGDGGASGAETTETGVSDEGSPVSGASSGAGTTSGTGATSGSRPAWEAENLLPPDHALAEGQELFLNGTWGVEVLDAWPPASFLLELMEEEPEVFGNQFERFGFLPDPSGDFPVGFRRGVDDPERVHETCALCHVAELPDGRVWIGAPNMALDFSRFRVEVSERWVAAGNEPLLGELQIEKALQLGPGRTGAESRDYPQVVPAAYPVYYDLGERSALNYMGTGQNLRTEAYFAIFTMGAGQPNAREAVVPFPERSVVDTLIAYMGQIPAAPAPPQDEALVVRGMEVFEEARCVSCHHVDAPALDGVVTLDREEDGLERFPGDVEAFPRGSIRTSGLHRVLQDGDGDDGLEVDDGFRDLIQFIISNRLQVAQTDGYRTSYLRGLWQSAPYLHNGSVPTLEDLLRPAAERPETFEVHGFTMDTRLPGNSNQGHAFGTDLGEADREALIAYLRSL